MRLKAILRVIILSLPCGIHSQEITKDEAILYDLLMQYRSQNNLPTIPISPKLTIVAQTHAKDLSENRPNIQGCNIHSWSDKGKWSNCCYTSDHSQAECMWNKPRELTFYQGYGYEIAVGYDTDSDIIITATVAIQSWKDSILHNDIILNKNIWEKSNWRAIGIGIYKGFACVWFGKEIDK